MLLNSFEFDSGYILIGFTNYCKSFFKFFPDFKYFLLKTIKSPIKIASFLIYRINRKCLESYQCFPLYLRGFTNPQEKIRKRPAIFARFLINNLKKSFVCRKDFKSKILYLPLLVCENFTGLTFRHSLADI